MTDYHLGFAEELINLAWVANEKTARSVHTDRAVLYLSLVSSEIAIKALLESANVPVSTLRKYGHNLSKLLALLNDCQIKRQVSPGVFVTAKANELRAKKVLYESNSCSVGRIISKITVSKDTQPLVAIYPNEIRYGQFLQHYPASAMIKCSYAVLSWVKSNIDYVSYQPDVRVQSL